MGKHSNIKQKFDEDEKDDLVTNEINIVIIGDEATGKTSLINCYAHDTFSTEYVPSIHNQFIFEVENYNTMS